MDEFKKNTELTDKIADEILSVMRKYNLTATQTRYIIHVYVAKKIRDIESNIKI